MKYVLMMLFLMGPGISRAEKCVDYAGSYSDGHYQIVITQDECSKVEIKYFDPKDLSVAMYDHIYTKVGNKKSLGTADYKVEGNYSWKISANRLVFLAIEHYSYDLFDRFLTSRTILSKNGDGSISEEYLNFDTYDNQVNVTRSDWKKLP